MGDYVKSECWLFFLFAGGVVLLLRPVWLFLLIPIFLQKFLHDNIQMWGVNDQYVIEFAPVIAMGVFDVIGTLQLGKARMPVAVIILLMTTGTTIRLMDRTSARVPKVNVRIYQAAHWQTSLPLDEIREAMAFIPDESTVSGQSFLLPHLAWRDKIYMFPMVKDAEYIFYTRGYNTYPVSEVEFNKSVNFLENNFGEWELVYIAKEVRLLKRK